MASKTTTTPGRAAKGARETRNEKRRRNGSTINGGEPESSRGAATEPETSGVCLDGPPTPTPAKEHEWLQRFVGVWDADIEMLTEPGQPLFKTTGTDTTRMLGGLWMISDGRNNEMPYECRLTLGFKPEIGKYVGTWVDTMSTHLWKYEGSVDATGKVLTLETEGPYPPVPGSICRFREVTEFKSRNHRVFTSSRLCEDGRWSAHMRIHFRRKK